MANKYLNLGCGSRFIESWTNVDFVSSSPLVLACDLNKGIPFDDNTFEVVYHSHVLEHFSKEKGEFFLKECFRVLKPGGIIRIAVPDLERLAKQYIENLEKALADGSEWNAENYKWAVIEMFDQMVRNHSGGEMGRYWTREKLINEDYVTGRVGHEFTAFRTEYLSSLNRPAAPGTTNKPAKKRFIDRVRNRLFITLFPNRIPNERLLGIGNFRSSGEIHQWMYDRYSLKVLLEQTGFKEVQQQQALTSKISNWNEFSILDVENGKVRKPDSLFMEAVKA